MYPPGNQPQHGYPNQFNQNPPFGTSVPMPPNIPYSPYPTTPFPNQGSGPSFGGPSNRLFDDLGGGALQLGLQYAKVSGYSNEALNTYNRTFLMLKYYFNVNNSYVLNKLKLLLFPLRHKVWMRRIQRQGEAEVFLPPRDDINAPDLYIPLMGFITYVLVIGFVYGAAYSFTPETLGRTASSGLAVLAFEVATIKTGFYLLNSLTVPILDVVAYCGYKYVGLVLTILIGLVFGQLAYYLTMLVTGAFMAIFMVKTLRLAFSERATPDSPTYGGGNHRRNYFLVALGGLQLLLQYYLSYDINRVG